MGLTCQLLPVFRELVGAPGTGESIKAAVISDRCAVDNELLGARRSDPLSTETSSVVVTTVVTAVPAETPEMLPLADPSVT